METLLPRPFNFMRMTAAALRPFVDQCQLLLDARCSKGGNMAEAARLTLEELMPIAEAPPGILGEFAADIGELRAGPGDTVALFTKKMAVVGSRAEVLGDMRSKLIASYERRIEAGEGNVYELAVTLRQLRDVRPALRVVKG